MVLRTVTKDENVPRPRTLLMVAARDRGRVIWDRGRGRSEVLDNARLGEMSPAAPVLKALYGSPTRALSHQLLTLLPGRASNRVILLLILVSSGVSMNGQVGPPTKCESMQATS
jgi:hypothetical protein